MARKRPKGTFRLQCCKRRMEYMGYEQGWETYRCTKCGKEKVRGV